MADERQELAQEQKGIEIFISYAHEDEELLWQLEAHLSMLKWQGAILTWYDQQIGAGTDWEQAIDTHLEQASVILLLISADFLASDYCYSIEMKRALERHQEKQTRVIPIVLRPVYWQGGPFARLQALPKDGKAITSWTNRDEAFTDVVTGLQRAIEEVAQKKTSAPRARTLPTPKVASEQDHAITTRNQPLGKRPRPHPFSFIRYGGGHFQKMLLFVAIACCLAAIGIPLFFIAGGPFSIIGKHATPHSPSIVPTHLTIAVTPGALSSYDSYVSQHGIMFGFDAQHTRTNLYEHILNATNVSQLRQMWDKPPTVGDRIDSSAPVVADGVVYVGSWDKTLYAFDALTGKEKWYALTEGKIYSAPAVANGVVYVGSYNGKLYAFKADGCGSMTCHPLWAASLGGSTFSSPAVANGMLYIGSDNGKLSAFDTASGVLKWVASTNTSMGMRGIATSPAVANGVVYVGSDDGKLYAFKADGCGSITCLPLWVASTGKAINSSPAVANGIVYIGSQDGHLYAFKAKGCGSMTCPPLWAATTGAIHDSSPAVANGVVYVGSVDGSLYAFDALIGGAPKWMASTGDAIHSSPSVANGVVYVGSDDRQLHAFDAATGAPLWASASTGDAIVCSPVVANGVVYVGSWDHKLYAFSLPEKRQN